MRMVLPHHMPGRLFNELASDMNALVGSILGDEPVASSFLPAMDALETETAYKLSLDVPGVNPDDISIEIEDGHVLIDGERTPVEAAEEVTWRSGERRFGDFRRKFRLPKLVDQERIEANYENGVLTVTLPKFEKKAAKKIVVTHSGAKSADESEGTPSAG